jgi:hypothetical protein
MWLPALEQAPANVKANPAKWASLNPDWRLHVWTYEALRNLIGDVYPGLLPIWESLDKPVKQADLARLLVIHAVGGAYLDMDLVPLSPIDNMLNSGVIYNRKLPRRPILPDKPSEDAVDYWKYKTIMSKQFCAKDEVGLVVANGSILSESGADWIMEFVEQQKHLHNGFVLDFVGTLALTRFIKSRLGQLQTDLLLLPPHYFLWEEKFLTCAPPDYTISIHPGENTWGDHAKHDWWKT